MILHVNCKHDFILLLHHVSLCTSYVELCKIAKQRMRNLRRISEKNLVLISVTMLRDVVVQEHVPTLY